MIRQGDILKVSGPIKGHEQWGYRPVLVLQRTGVTEMLKSVVICLPITTSGTNLPFEVALPKGMKTTGKVLCRYIRSLDLNSREYSYVEHVPEEILEECINNVNMLIEKES